MTRQSVTPGKTSSLLSSGLLQRKCDVCGQRTSMSESCSQCQDKDAETLHRSVARSSLQRRAANHQNEPDEAPPIVYEVLNSPGQPLDSETQEFMESRFDQDFSQVKVHTDTKAAESARTVNSRAYTIGRNVVFAKDQYKPTTLAGKQLLAHELTHVIQQREDSQKPHFIQRLAINNCVSERTIDKRTIDIYDAVVQASSDVATVLPKLFERPVPESVKNALWLAFRADSDLTVNLIQHQIEKISAQIANITFTCQDEKLDPDCSDDSKNFAHAPINNEKGTVSICPKFFTKADKLLRSQIIIHEAAHMYLGVKDTGYFEKQPTCSETKKPQKVEDPEARFSGTAGDNPFIRFQNADSYACFIYLLNHEKEQKMKETAEKYRGEKLRIEPKHGDRIYTKTSSPQIYPFSIKEIPENSGFSFAWELIGNGRNYQVLSLRSGNTESKGVESKGVESKGVESKGTEKDIDAGIFNEENSAVYVPTSSANRLWIDGVKQATLKCKILLYKEDSRRLVSEIIRERTVLVEDDKPFTGV